MATTRPTLWTRRRVPLPIPVVDDARRQCAARSAAAAANVNNAIIAVVDRNGTILGVRVESGVSPDITGNTTNLVFAVDGAVSLARTGAYFANDSAPLTSRTIQQISQTTITQREVDSNPDVPSDNGNSTLYGPGFVAPVGIKGHFPPGIMFTPQVDLFDIESTNRDSISPITGTRFNVPSQYIPAGGNLVAPESYGQVTGILPTAQPRGIATLPGGVPLYKQQPKGCWSAASASSFRVRPDMPPKKTRRSTRRRSLTGRSPTMRQIGEYMALVAAGGSAAAGLPIQRSRSTVRRRFPDSPNPSAASTLPASRSTSSAPGGLEGLNHLLTFGATLGGATPMTAPTYRSIQRTTPCFRVREYRTAGWSPRTTVQG